ncbi:MAG: alpha/beta fold hydrolase, partial [Pseudomonadota bacterium]
MSIVFWTFLVVVGLFGAAYVAGRRNSAKALAAVPKVGENTPVPGGSIHSIEAGQGQPVVCIHGLGANLHSLQYALGPILAKEFRTILIDRPGCGYSERASADLAPLSEQAKMVAAFL